MNATITYTECGCIVSAWVRLPGRPAIQVADHAEGLTDPQLVARAQRVWAERDRETAAYAELRRRHPNAIVIGEYGRAAAYRHPGSKTPFATIEF